MNARGHALDRVRLDGVTVAPRSSTLYLGPGVRAELSDCAWWVYLAGCPLADSLRAGARTIAFSAWTAGGRELSGGVRIVERVDDLRGTRLVLAGVSPAGGASG